MPMGDDANQRGISRRWIITEVENSLRRLGTDWIEKSHRAPRTSMMLLPTCQRYGMGVMTYSPLAMGWLSGHYRKDREIAGPGSAARRQRFPERYDLSLPVNQRKLDAADALGVLADKAGMSLVQMAIAFATQHPAVTAAIIGPRTMEHLESQLDAADVTLSDEILDQIDEIVPPGVTINPADNMSFGPALTPAARRR